MEFRHSGLEGGFFIRESKEGESWRFGFEVGDEMVTGID